MEKTLIPPLTSAGPSGQKKPRIGPAGYRKIMVAGLEAFEAGKPMSDCPYPGPRCLMRSAWLAGWFDGQSAEGPARSSEPVKTRVEER